MYRITDMFKDNTEIILGEISTTKFAVYQKFCLNHTQSKKRMSCSINNSLRQAIIPQKPGKCLNREEKASPRLCTPRAVISLYYFPWDSRTTPCDLAAFLTKTAWTMRPEHLLSHSLLCCCFPVLGHSRPPFMTPFLGHVLPTTF